MPFFDPSADETLPRLPSGGPPPANAVPVPMASDWFKAYLRQENAPAAAFTSLFKAITDNRHFDYDPNHNPLDIIRGTKFEFDHLDAFTGSRNEAETRSIMRKIDSEDRDRQTLSAAGAAGVAAQVGLGLLDPTLLIPGGAIFKAGRAGATVVRGALSLAAAGAASSAIDEGVLYATHETITPDEVAVNVAAATVLSGLLGAGAGALLSRGETQGVTKLLQADRDAWSADLRASAAGAAATDTREVQPRPSGLNRVFDLPGVRTIAEGPTTQVFQSDFVSGRRAMATLAESPLQMQEHVEGIPTAPGGALSRRIQQIKDAGNVRIADTLDGLYRQYRFGTGETNALARTRRALVGFSTPTDGKLTFADFKAQVDWALIHNDQHEVPEVAEAANVIRGITQPWVERAVKAGFFDEIPEVKTAASWSMRDWNVERVKAERPILQTKIATWLGSEQGKKAAIKDRLTSLNDDLDRTGDLLSGLEARTARAGAKGDRLATRLDERTGEVDRTANRETVTSQQVVDKQDEIDAATVAHALEIMGGIARPNPDGPGFIAGLTDTLARRGVDRIRSRMQTLRVLEGKQEEAARAAGANERRAVHLEAQRFKNEVRQELLDAAHDLARQTHEELRAKIETALGEWQGKSADEAKAALKARTEAERLRGLKQEAGIYEGRGERLTSADAAVSRALKRILASDRDLSVEELNSRANEIIDRILGGPAGRLPYDAPSGGPRIGVPDELGPRRGSLHAREFMIPDEAVWDFLEHDVEAKMRKYFGTFIPDVMLAETFGDPEMTTVFRQLAEEKAAKVNATPQLAAKQRKAIDAEANRVAANLAGVRDRIRGTYGWTSDTFAKNMGRVASAVNSFSTLTDMGGVALSSLPDMAGTVFRWGFTAALRDAWVPFLKHLTAIDGRDGAYAAAKQQFRALGISAETITAARKNAWGDILSTDRAHSRFEKSLHVASDKFFLVNLLAPWTDLQKTMAGMVASSELMRAAKATAAGTATRKQVTRLAEAGFDRALAEQVWREFSGPGGGNDIRGVLLANTGAWTSPQARTAFEAAIGREADIMVVTPGQEKPLWLSTPLGSVIGRFKSFVSASNERLLMANLQQHDLATVQGLIFTVAFGMLSEAAYSVVAGRPAPQSASDWVKQGMSRSGVLGWFEEGNAISAKLTAGSLDLYRLIGSDKPLSRYQSRTILSSLLGPTAGKVENLAQITQTISPNVDWTAADTTRVRRFVAGQNLLYLRRLLDQVEASTNGFFGVKSATPARH